MLRPRNTTRWLMGLVAASALAIAYRDVVYFVVASAWAILGIIAVLAISLCVGVILPVGILLEVSNRLFGWPASPEPGPDAGNRGPGLAPPDDPPPWDDWWP